MKANTCVSAEWIVVDDGSGAAFDQIFFSLPQVVRVVRLAKNVGQAAARNAGLALTGCKWIKFLDADDQLDAGHLSALLSATGDGAALPFAPTRHVFHDGGSVINSTWRDLAPDARLQLARFLSAPFLSHCGALFPRDVLMRVGGYDESLVTDEDGDLLIRLLMQGAYFKPVPAVTYHYIHHTGANRVSTDSGKGKLAARLRVCDKVEAAYKETADLMPAPIRLGLALRLDKIALSYWDEDRSQSRLILARAKRLCPGYSVPGRWPVRLLRTFGGPSAVINALRWYRRLRGRPLGGSQG